MKPKTEAWVSFGTIARAHGVRGELRLVSATPGIIFPSGCEKIRVKLPDKPAVFFTVSKVRAICGATLLSLLEIQDRNAAELLSGAEVEIERQVLPEPGADEIYVYELIGAAVEDEAGNKLGVVGRLLDNAGQGLLEIISKDGGELLLPVVDETVVHLDRQRHVLVIRPIPGLWELS